MLAPLLSGVAVAALAVGLALLAAVAGGGHLLFGLLVDEFGRADPARRRRGRWSFDAGVALFAAGFLGMLALFVVDDAMTAATGLGFGDLLYAGVGAMVVGALAMVAGMGLALEEGR